MTSWRPLTPERLADELAERVAGRSGIVRLALDGAPATAPAQWAAALDEPLRRRGRPTVTLSSRLFWRPASVRLEHGRHDVESYLTWLDHAALQREVLRPAVERGEYLPSLRDPETDRSTREVPRPLPDNAVLVVHGELLLGLGLAFDLAVHLAMSAAALARRTPEADAWTLPAFTDYVGTVRPGDLDDVVVTLDDPRRPAARGLIAR